MKRINITFYDESYEKLEEHMRENKHKSIAQSVREMVDFGFRIKEAALKNDNNQEKNELDKLIEMHKNILIWSLETRLLTRYLVENLSFKYDVNAREVLEKYKGSAINYIKGLLGENIK